MKFSYLDQREKTSQAIRDALRNKSKSRLEVSKSLIYSDNTNLTKFNHKVRDSYPEQSTMISHVMIDNLSISSQVCLEETMDDIVSILASMDNVTKTQVCDNQTKYGTENENWIPVPLDDNDFVVIDTIGDDYDFMSELKNGKTEPSSLNSITYEDNSSSSTDPFELSYSDIQYILSEWDGM